MNRGSKIGIVALLSTVIWMASCSAGRDLFSEDGSSPGTGIATTTGSGATGTGSGSGGSQGGTGGIATGGQGGTAGTGGTGTGSCAHDECDYGDALEATCSPCATAICADEGTCCGDEGEWDYRCIDLVGPLCPNKSCGGQPPCDNTYGDVNDYVACAETASMCAFGFNNLFTSCNAVCSARGAECVLAYDNQDNTYCEYAEARTCEFVTGGVGGETYNVCVCSRGCGSGPLCPNQQSCEDGSCH